MATTSRPVGNNAKRALEQIEELAADSIEIGQEAKQHLNSPDYIRRALAEIRANQEAIWRIASQIMSGTIK